MIRDVHRRYGVKILRHYKTRTLYVCEYNANYYYYNDGNNNSYNVIIIYKIRESHDSSRDGVINIIPFVVRPISFKRYFNTLQ